MKSGFLGDAGPVFQVSLSITRLENVKSLTMVDVGAPVIASKQRKIVRVNVVRDTKAL